MVLVLPGPAHGDYVERDTEALRQASEAGDRQTLALLSQSLRLDPQ